MFLLELRFVRPGLPALVGADRSDSFEHFIERIIQRINGWKEKQLSIGAKKFF
jgi:hypothetical protein